MLKEYKNWTGNIDELRNTAFLVIQENDIEEINEVFSIRLTRDYVARGLLGTAERAGKELQFNYGHLLRFTAVRIMLNDGWSLTKIRRPGLAIFCMYRAERIFRKLCNNSSAACRPPVCTVP